jgi:hypothetical protein
MAITFNNIYALSVAGPDTTITNTINIGTGLDHSVMIVIGNGHTASDAITSMTWNGVALTKVQVQAPTGSNDRYIYIFMLVNPDSGSHDLVINNSTSAYFFGSLAVYNGAAQTGQPDNSGKSTSAAATTFNETLTINTADSWLIGWAHHWNGNLAAGTDTTLRTAAAVTGLGDSNAGLATGSRSIQFTGTSETWMGVFLSLAPFTGSPSPSLSLSLSPSVSVSLSPSVSVSLSPSVSESASPSLSPSSSLSLSPSLSPSLSVSASPSIGFSNYTRGNYVALPGNDNDLEVTYTTQDETDVSTKNDVRVGQTGVLEYMVHQFKDFVGSNTSCQVEWEGQTSQAPSASIVYLQVYNRNTTTWDTLTSNNTANIDTDFNMTAEIADLTNYKDASNVISCRVYQLSL